MPELPALIWCNRQRSVPSSLFDLPKVELAVQTALPEVLESSTGAAPLRKLSEVCFVLVSDRRIAQVHVEFLDDPTPTDVITFLHGEIVISAETAWREAQDREISPSEELARYAVHGLLHLAGWTDQTTGDASRMRARQEKILRRALSSLC
jgi:probable rRNA maturation factor